MHQLDALLEELSSDVAYDIRSLLPDDCATTDEVVAMIKSGELRCQAAGVKYRNKRVGSALQWGLLLNWLKLDVRYPAGFGQHGKWEPILPTVTPRASDAPDLPASTHRQRATTPEAIERRNQMKKMRDVDGMTYKAIAEHFGVSSAAVQVQYCRACRSANDVERIAAAKVRNAAS